MKWEIYELKPGEIVSCAICESLRAGDSQSYGRGEAFLCPPAFYSANADYICRFHVEHSVPRDEIEIVDVYATEAPSVEPEAGKSDSASDNPEPDEDECPLCHRDPCECEPEEPPNAWKDPSWT